MMFIDMTKELAPILYGLDLLLIVSTAAIVSRTAVSTWFGSTGRLERPRLVLHRPVLAR